MHDDEIRAGIERMQGLWDYLVQNTHGGSHLNYAVYHDRYQRTTGGWKFSERVYEVNTWTPHRWWGSAPGAAGARDH